VFHLLVFQSVHERTGIVLEASRSFDQRRRRARMRCVEALPQTGLHPLR
jgi:hypothetical protein